MGWLTVVEQGTWAPLEFLDFQLRLRRPVPESLPGKASRAFCNNCPQPVRTDENESIRSGTLGYHSHRLNL